MSSWRTLRSAVLDLGVEEQDWVEVLQAEADALLGDGLGTFAYAYRIEQARRIHITALAGHDGAPELWQSLSSWGGENQHALARIYRTNAGSIGGAVASAARTGTALTTPARWFEAHGVADARTIVGHDSAGRGVFLTVPHRSVRLPPRAGDRRTFERLSIELAAAVRLRGHRRGTSVARLSASELRVARLLVEGASDKDIAAELAVSLSTVSTFARRVRRKLGCRPGGERLTFLPSAQLRCRLELFERLTDAECDVASELLVGASYAEIAARRGASTRTVASQCTAIFHKLCVSGRRELAATLLRG